MSPQTIREIVLDTIHSIAPETDLRKVTSALPLRQAIELDSMDWLNVVTGLEERLGVEFLPGEYARLSTIDAIVDHVASLQARGALPPRPASPEPSALPCSQHVIAGKVVSVRPMRADDLTLKDEFVRHLSRMSRYQRFMVSVNELPLAKLGDLTHVDQTRHVALVAETVHQGERALVGVVRYVVDDSGAGCEFALAIDDAWQGSGLAGILMQKLMTIARARGLATMEGLILRANDRMLKLSRQLGFTQQIDPQDRQMVRVVRAL